ncbi:MAG: G5 domain-containing protein [Eubacteriaceae bacterium]
MDVSLKNLKDRAYKNKYILLVAVAFFLLTIVLILKLNNNSITIVEGNNEFEYSYRGKYTVEDVLIKQNINLNEEDEVIPALSTVLNDGDVVTIKKAVEVAITVDNKVYEFLTPEREVGKIIEGVGITLGEIDIVEPNVETLFEEDDIQDIQIVRVEQEVEKDNQILKYNTVVKNNDNLDKGFSRVTQTGKDGEKVVEELVTYHDGEEFAREVVEEKIIKETVNEIKEVGTNTLIATSRGSKRFLKAMYVTVTGYCSCSLCVGDHNGSITASGKKTQAYHTVAAPANLAFGTEIYMPYFNGASNGGVFVVEDRGGSIRGNRIDIYFNSHEEAIKFGKRTIKIYVLE